MYKFASLLVNYVLAVASGLNNCNNIASIDAVAVQVRLVDRYAFGRY